MPVPDSPRVQCRPRCPQEQALGLPLEPRRLRRALSQQPLNCQSWLPAFERRSLELEEFLPWGACPESPAGQWEELQELAQLDGAFVVSEAGIFISACRYLDAAGAGVEMPLGLGSRHLAAANMTTVTEAVGIVVSESATVRIFCHGSFWRR